MKITTKIMLVLAVLGSVVLTSCKDYDDDNYKNAIIASNATLNDALAKQKEVLEAEIQTLKDALAKINSCECTDMMTEDQVNALIDKKIAALKLEDAIKALQDQIDAINNAGYQTADQVTALIEGNASVQKAIKDAADAAKKVEDLANTVEDVKKALDGKADQTAVDELQTTVNKLQETVNNLQETVNQLANVKIELNSRIDSLKNVVVNIEAQVQTNKDSIQILKELIDNKTIDLSKYYTVDQVDSVVDANTKNFATISQLEKAADSIRQIANAYTDSAIVKVNAALDGKADTATVNGIAKELKDAEITYSKAILALGTEISKLQKRVDTLEAQMKDVNNYINALKKQVTGIIVQQVWNPAFGTYNSLLTNAQTNMLIAYVGKSVGSGITFPDTEIFYDAAVTEELPEGKLMNDGGNAGKVYLTINPNTVDFEGLDLSLVNSQDKACAIKLSNVKKYDGEALSVGWTRSGNGLYVAEANLSEKDAINAQYINVDKSAAADAIKDLLKARSKSDLKAPLKELASVAYDAIENLNDIQAQGIKCAWTDTLGEHAVYSNYNIAAIQMTPLSFNALDEIETDTYFQDAKDLIKKAYDKVVNKICNRYDKEKEKYQKKLDARGIRSVQYESNCITVTISLLDEDYNVMTDIVDGLNAMNAEAVAEGKEEPAKFNEQTATEYTATVKLSIDESDDVVAGYAANDIANISKMANDLLDQINSAEEKIKGDKILNKIYAYVDRFNAKFNHYKKNMLQPTLYVNSDKGFKIAGYHGAPCQASGKIMIVPTTATLEIAAPIYKKYIRIKNAEGQVTFEKIYQGSDQEGKELNITEYLSDGVNTISYAAMDFSGKEIDNIYEINYKK